MIHCFLTGVQVSLESAYVLNRREARMLMHALNDRVASLSRLIDQFAPLDDEAADPPQARAGDFAGARRKHRLVCKAVVGALSPAFPEIGLFIEWPKYQAQARTSMLTAMRGHPEFGAAIRAIDDEALAAAERIGKAVLREFDPLRQLPAKTRSSIVAALCVRHRGRAASEIVQLIRQAVPGNQGAQGCGVAPHDLAAIHRLLAKAAPSQSPATPAT